MTPQEIISECIPSSGLYHVGHADMGKLLSGQYAQYRYAIVIVRKLDDVIVDSVSLGPNKAYLDHYYSVNNALAEIIIKMSFLLAESGILSMPVRPTVKESELAPDYAKTLRMPFSHKMAATRAGLGWIGKTDLLITRKFGPRARLAAVLLKEKLFSTGRPVESSECGACSICVEACPAQACTGKLWNIKIDRDAFFDAFKCREKCRDLSAQNLNEKISLCGICVSVCPKRGS
jgi:epoxyqueuosine reductase